MFLFQSFHLQEEKHLGRRGIFPACKIETQLLELSFQMQIFQNLKAKG